MKFALSWLQALLDTKADAKAIAEKLTTLGLEIEGVEDASAALTQFKVARVLTAEKHPQADKLQVLSVDLGDGNPLQVVCGAPNARAGLVGVLGLPGAVVPANGMELRKSAIRGVESNGMMCSTRELGLGEEHDGIIELPADAPLGTSFADYLGSDPVFDVAITPNRPDCMGVHGIARDLAAAGLGVLKPIDAKPVSGTYPCPVEVRTDDPEGCPAFYGRVIRGVKNGPSPQWLQDRLKSAGQRPISALVDVTNYITFAYGRPLHVFDADKVKGDIRARAAQDGETLAALDNRTYTLAAGMTVIADDAGPEAIAGIIGGSPSGCTGETVNVFLESAYFDPLKTAATGRKLGITSDARYRFERGVDPAFTPVGAEIATRMILELCGGEASHVVTAGAAPDTARSYALRKTRVKTLAGVDVPVARQTEILSALGFAVTEMAETLDCAVPSWRPDVRGEADLVEEVARIWGLDTIPPQPMERISAIARPVLTPLQKRMLAARRTLAARGFNEAITWAFLAETQAKLFGGGQPELKLANPISSELSDMRPSLLPNLIAAAGRNMDRGFADMMLAEVGHAYAGDRPQDETLRAAGLRRGAVTGRNVHGQARAVDAFDAKADALAVLEAAGAAVASLQVVAGAPAWFHPGRSGTIQMGPQNKLGFFGEIHPRVLAAMDVKGPLVAFELILNAIPGSKSKSATRPPLVVSDLLPVTRDFAFVVEEKVEAEKLVKAAKSADKALISDVTVFDLYRLEGGRTSLAIEVTLQPRDKTLTEPEIEAVSAKIVQAVAKATGGTLRS